MTTENTFCEACNLRLHPSSYEQHINGKKHKIKQQQNDKLKTIFVSGTRRFSPQELEKLFSKYGEIAKVDKKPSKPFAFIRYVSQDSVERALSARVFSKGVLLFIGRHRDANPQEPEGSKGKTRKLSETISNTSQSELESGSDQQRVGLQELPVQLRDSDCWDGEDVFQWQVHDFVSQVELSAEMYSSLNEVKSDMEELFQRDLPGSRVVIFGSCGSTLAFKNSDVDLFLQTANGEPLTDFVRKEAKAMYRSRLFRIKARIAYARVPIVKFEHVKTGWLGDLTASSELGVRNSQLLRFLVSLDPRVKPLVMVIKYWAKVCEIRGDNRKMTTYSVVMLVVYYLQQLETPMLPTIAQLQRLSRDKQYSLGWECSFCDEDWKVQTECTLEPNNLSIKELLTGFFRFYHNFDFNNVICPLLGKSIPVEKFKSDDGSDLPEEMFLYKEKLKSDPRCKFKTDVTFRMQDPFELCFNVTRNVAEKTCGVFKEACKVSLALCEKEGDNTLLKSLFSIDPKTLYLCDDSFKITIKYNQGAKDVNPDCALEQWHKLTTDSIILVLTHIFKLKVEPQIVDTPNKVKKLDLSQDVHTLLNNPNEDKVLLCSGKGEPWISRGKTSRLMNRMGVAMSGFEREVCISNALYSPDDKNAFSFTLVISSLEHLKKERKGIDVKIEAKVLDSIVKRCFYCMKNDLKNFVVKASKFINQVKSSCPETQVEESLTALFELKLQNLPDLKEVIDKEALSGTINEDKKIEGQNVLIMSEEFSKSKSPNQINVKANKTEKFSQNSDEHIHKVSFNKLQGIETSTFTSNETNPFLASIEKVALKVPDLEIKTSDRQNVHNQEKTNISCENNESQLANKNTSKGQENSVRTEENKDQGDVNPNPLERNEGCVEDENASTSTNLLSTSQNTTVQKTDKNSSTNNESMNMIESVWRSEENISLQVPKTYSQIVSRSEENICLQRPKKNSERASKPRRPNSRCNNASRQQPRPRKGSPWQSQPVVGQRRPNRRDTNASWQRRHSWNGAPWQPWVGGGPPGCRPWQRPPNPPMSQNPPNHHNNYQGSNRGAEWNNR